MKAKGKKNKIFFTFPGSLVSTSTTQEWNRNFSSSKTTRCVIVKRPLLGKSTKTGQLLPCKLSLQCSFSAITYLVDVDRQKDGKKNCRKLNVMFAQDKDQWRALTNTVINFLIP
jgi:hypothetical protein